MLFQIAADRFHCNFCRPIKRKMVHASRNRWEIQRSAPVPLRQHQTGEVAALQQPFFSCAAAAPDRSRCMNHVFCGQPVPQGNLCFSRPAAIQGSAFSKKFRTSRAMDCAVHSSAAQQRGVCCIDNGIRMLFGNITCYNGKRHLIPPIHIFFWDEKESANRSLQTLLVETKRIELSTSRMRTVRSPS
jgi:hypothetical protein